jgi:flagellar biosynthesis protein FliR
MTAGSLFAFSQEEMLSFFAVLVRYSVLVSVLPFVGDRLVPVPVKVLLALVLSVALFPSLVSRGYVRPGDSLAWGASASGIAGVMASETLFALMLGYTARLAFDAVSFGGNLVGNFMGYAMASSYDPHQESQSQVVAEIHMAIAMLLFLTLDGHHLMLRASLDSYSVLGVGKLGGVIMGSSPQFGQAFSQRLIELGGQVIRFGVLLAAPVAISLFAVNVAFGVMAKAMPQVNVLVLSFAVSAFVGLIVMLIGLPELQGATAGVLGKMGEWMESVTLSIAQGR